MIEITLDQLEDFYINSMVLKRPQKHSSYSSDILEPDDEEISLEEITTRTHRALRSHNTTDEIPLIDPLDCLYGVVRLANDKLRGHFDIYPQFPPITQPRKKMKLIDLSINLYTKLREEMPLTNRQNINDLSLRYHVPETEMDFVLGVHGYNHTLRLSFGEAGLPACVFSDYEDFQAYLSTAAKELQKILNVATAASPYWKEHTTYSVAISFDY